MKAWTDYPCKVQINLYLHDFNFQLNLHLIFFLQHLLGNLFFARLSHLYYQHTVHKNKHVHKPLPQRVITMWNKGSFSGNHINQSGSATANVSLGHFLNTGSSPHIFMKLSAGSHMVKVVPIGCGRNRRPVSTSFVV